ncbi:hypothetical protein N7526_011438 [Penicillium atrosanguineum]|nr:hypothetical protein N7526_011438 [Penicillium atrosanguineum]
MDFSSIATKGIVVIKEMIRGIYKMNFGRKNVQNKAADRQKPLSERKVPSSTLTLDKLPESVKNERAKLLLKLHNEPASSSLRAYFETLKDASREWNINNFIEGANYLSNIVGPGKEKYYTNTLKGLHYAESFTQLWNEKYPQQPITALEPDIKYQCPPGWSHKLNEDFRHVLTYEGGAPLGDGLNALVEGPTTLDCGMWCQVLLWMAIRYLVGDELFHQLFQFKKGEFAITQQSYQPMDSRCKGGNLLYPLHDKPLLVDVSETQTRIQILSVFNHPNYLKKHPGGMARLQNVVKIDDYNMVFEPGAHQNTFLDTELENDLMGAYNAPRDFSDTEKLWLWDKMSGFKHPHFEGRSFGDLAEEAKEFADHTLSESEWNSSRADRENMAVGCHLIFNFQRLIRCLNETRKLYLDGDTETDIISRARRLQAEDILERLRMIRPITRQL